jgi:hypothetical protein
MENTAQKRSFTICIPTKYQSGDQIKNELRGACSKYRGQDRFIQYYGGKTWERDHYEDLGADGS